MRISPPGRTPLIQLAPLLLLLCLAGDGELGWAASGTWLITQVVGGDPGCKFRAAAVTVCSRPTTFLFEPWFLQVLQRLKKKCSQEGFR